METLFDENLITLRQAASRCKVHVASCARWALKGVGGIKLESIKLGGRRYTSVEALQRFAEATTAAADKKRPSKPRTSKLREQQIAQAEAALDAAGICDRPNKGSA